MPDLRPTGHALVHDGIGVWLAARHLNAGHFVWSRNGSALTPTRAQLDAPVAMRLQAQLWHTVVLSAKFAHRRRHPSN
ncbi:MAG: hypothetical protein CVU31_00135 [Betaproteobacteria bacterium HGW-Betaproteobacteria-4]|jgi:hypothetical protein|nr:MAG: hypothetical protein CVU31_00135 [Betaproteobacteria bacterium HGW-Betaproteobacteria-4]